jgi:hypothetical protein
MKVTVGWAAVKVSVAGGLPGPMLGSNATAMRRSGRPGISASVEYPNHVDGCPPVPAAAVKFTSGVVALYRQPTGT